MNKIELLKHIGSIEQIGGIRDFTLNDGKSKGVRVIEVNTGIISFSVIVDRCMDIAQAFFKGKSLSWISKTGITSPQYYEKENNGWLRGFYGGLFTTCGLKHIGSPTSSQGLHGRVSYIPAKDISVFADWIDNDYIISISGKMNESIVFDENLVLKRTISTKLFDNSFSIQDEVVNEGFLNQDVAMGYHCNFGYPLVNQNSKIINVPDEYSSVSKPMPNIPEQCIPIEYNDNTVRVGIENKDIGAYITYNRDALHDFVLWKMPREGEYTIGLEPRTTCLGGEDIKTKNKYISLKPFESLKNKLTFTFCELNI